MEQFIALAQFAAVVVAVFAVVFNVTSIRRQTQVQTFITLSNEYAELFDSRPREIRTSDPEFAGFFVTAEETADPNASHGYLERFFTLMFREYSLYQAGAIQQRIWKEWVKHLEEFMSRSFYLDGWRGRWREHLSVNEEFVRWMDKLAVKGARRLKQRPR